jgi:F-type H+-transporting ATPase subunit b
MQFFATETTTETTPGLFEALGINWQLFIAQAIAFLILVAILGKFVYPVLVKTIEDRRTAIEEGLKEAKEGEAALEKAEATVAEMLAKARTEADEILARTHQEATSLVAEAEDKAKKRGEQIVSAAREQLDLDITKARETLKKDTIELVALATERVVGEKLNAEKDADLLKNSLERV